MNAPKRIQLRRTAGWRKPEGAVVVARPTRWGNPFTVADCLDAGWADNEADARAACVRFYSYWLAGDPDWGPAFPERRERILRDLPLIAGRDLACWCPIDGPCHADVLLRAVAPPDGAA